MAVFRVRNGLSRKTGINIRTTDEIWDIRLKPTKNLSEMTRKLAVFSIFRGSGGIYR